MYQKHIKRLLDVVLSFCILLILSPLLLIIALVIKLDSKGPVFFAQKRVGIHKSYFMISKFRTMRTDTPEGVPTHLLENPQQHITRCGEYLRRKSLDELPQFFNVLRGDMAIIGPRPALWNQYDLIEMRDETGANDVMPGITGLAQVHGRDELSNAEKAKLDGLYAQNISFMLDLKCFLRTIVKAGSGDGIVEGIQARQDSEENR
ncbi:MAG TPA: sugar transferase [Candidatus Limiplasma sp.]|nr:sugar transferase [Candidatus Limiplasma sp.]